MIKLTNYTNIYRTFAKNLIESSFPEEERPDFDELISRKSPEYKFNIITINDENCGIIGYWEFDDFIHIEHFAVSPNMRSSGIGGEFLNNFFSQTNKLIVLEVEVPDNEISIRRIKFYERHGMHFNVYHYMQPSYKTKEFVMQQHIMSSKKLTESEFETIRDVLYEKVYLIKS
ncbi:GNAT family N-acetyltransferase [Bacteroidales bacterium OttesenSCG-928-K03]|nr:GNAT family N-acetyltransferase [Bacteroidales bacterium OttesenSCG-928-K03]